MQTHPVRYYRRSHHARERRSYRRYNAPLVFCQLLAPNGTDDVVLLDLSTRGACLGLPFCVEKGTVLSLLLSNSSHLCSRQTTLRVTHCRRHVDVPFVVGGPFEEQLPPEILHALLG